MQKMKFYIDTHDRAAGTFPEQLSQAQFAEVFPQYEAACQEEGVVVLRVHLNLEEGKMFCFNMAPTADAVKRAHARVGLTFDAITEVSTATPGDLYFAARP